MEAQRKFGLRILMLFAATALVGFGQAQTGASTAAPTRSAAQYPITKTAPANSNSQQKKSAYPGAVNYVEGNATIDGRRLTPNAVGSTVVEPNQVIDTTNGYVEVLLTPGAFLRIGHNSEVRVISAGLARVNFELNHGSAMVEVADLVHGSKLDVSVDHVSVQIDKKGLYELDATQGTVRVLDGKATVEEVAHSITLKKGDEVALNDQPAKKHGFDMKSAKTEPLYVWSRVRSEEEAQANEHAANVVLAGGAWYGPGWYWDPLWAGYAFLPGTGILYSPFGWGFYSPAYYSGLWAGGFGYPGVVYRHGYAGRGFAHAHVGGLGAMHAGPGFHGGRR